MKINQKNNQPLITVIVPVFNSEKYISECLNSIICQSYFNLQIIVIDDGSTDLSGDLCEGFTPMDKRLTVIHQKNSGVSAARNTGLAYATGEYLAFIDSDDYVSADYIQKLYQSISEADIAICGYHRIEQNSMSSRIQTDIPASLNHDSLFHYVLCNNYIGGYLWNKLFRTSIINLNHITFDTSLSIGEDMLFISKYLTYARKGIYLSEALYYYRLNTDSALQNSYKTRKFNIKNISNLDASDLINKVIINESSAVHTSMSYRYIRTSIWLIFNMLNCQYLDKTLLKRIEGICRNNLFSYLHAKEARLFEKLVAIGISVHSPLFYNIGLRIFFKFPKSFLKKYLN